MFIGRTLAKTNHLNNFPPSITFSDQFFVGADNNRPLTRKNHCRDRCIIAQFYLNNNY